MLIPKATDTHADYVIQDGARKTGPPSRRPTWA